MRENDHPPYSVLLEILENIPWTIYVYYVLWKNQDSKSIKIHVQDVEDIYLISPSLFREYLFDLSQINVLSFSLDKDYIVIKLLEDQIQAQGLALC